MSGYGYTRRRAVHFPLMQVLTALVIIFVVAALALGVVALVKADAADKNRIHASMDAMAAEVDPNAKVMFETWNGIDTREKNYQAEARVIFGDVYRDCQFTDRYGMQCLTKDKLES